MKKRQILTLGLSVAMTTGMMAGVVSANAAEDPPYYRGCWHGVSRSLFIKYMQTGIHTRLYSFIKEVYNP